MDADEQAIRELTATWMQATKNGDVETVLSLMTDDAVFLVCGRPPMIGKAAFEAALRAQSPGSGDSRPQIDGQSEVQEVTIAGDWAYMWTRLRVEMTPPNGATVVRAGHTLTIFRREGATWRLCRDANMLTPVAPRQSHPEP
jgi:uncharacterized protein (TIGR02246 family)